VAVESVLRIRRIKRRRWQSLFDDIRIMEIAALKAINAKK